MPYHAYKEGSRYRILHESWLSGKRQRRSITEPDLTRLGFKPEMTLEAARAQAKLLSSNEKEERKRNRTALRVVALKEKESQYLPGELVVKFESSVIAKEGYRLSHWNTVQQMIQKVNLHPMDWFPNRRDFYDWIAQQSYSPDYAKRLIKLLNEWGYYLCYSQRTTWREIPAPRGKWYKRIKKAYHRKYPNGMKSHRLSPSQLESKKTSFTEEEYVWVSSTIAFGLRPEESTKGFEAGFHRWTKKGLYIIQFKLIDAGYEFEQCWKFIPIKTLYQRRISVLLQKSKGAAVPAGKMKAVFGKGFYRYAGRRWFARWALKKFGELRAVRMMGHKDLNTLRRHYTESEAPPEAK